MSLATFQAVKSFLPRCKIARTPADVTAAGNVNLLILRFADAFWARVLTELTAADVFAEPMFDMIVARVLLTPFVLGSSSTQAKKMAWHLSQTR